MKRSWFFLHGVDLRMIIRMGVSMMYECYVTFPELVLGRFFQAPGAVFFLLTNLHLQEFEEQKTYLAAPFSYITFSLFGSHSPRKKGNSVYIDGPRAKRFLATNSKI